MASDEKKQVVLVHGTGHGGWCWRLLTPILRAEGHEVHAPTLSGLGSSSHMLKCGVDLTTHIEDITKLLFYEDLHDTVLVGHSYAGMVITGVAVSATERLSKLVYLDAYIPREGQSEFDLWPEEWQAKALADIEAGTTTRSPASLFPILGISDEKIAEWVKTRLTPHPLSTYMQAPPSSTPDTNLSLAHTFPARLDKPFQYLLPSLNLLEAKTGMYASWQQDTILCSLPHASSQKF